MRFFHSLFFSLMKRFLPPKNPKIPKMDPPIVVIIGSTGTGKSKLAIEIAKEFNGEIISADSMQVYKGLDIITNKVTRDEMRMVPHHLIDFLDPLSRFTVVDYRNKSLESMNNLFENNKLPVIVGGTNYYIESLIWKVLIDCPESNDTLLYDRDARNAQIPLSLSSDNFKIIKDMIFSSPITADSLYDIPSEKLHKILQIIDPEYALKLHPHEKRKIIRSLQVYQQKGQKHSQLIKEQRSLDGGSSLGGPLRFTNACILWLQCDPNVLNKRLDERVDEMIDKGLVQELLNFHDNYNKYRLKNNIVADYTKGIFQSIGFKEFHNYLILSDDERQNEKSIKLLNKGIDDLKVATKRYAKQQIKWINNRFLKIHDRPVPNVFALDCTLIDNWKESITDRAFEIVNCYVNGHDVHHLNPLPKLEKTIINSDGHFYCEICEKTICGTHYWNEHLKSRKHYKSVKSKNMKIKNYEKLIKILEAHENNLKRSATSVMTSQT